MREEKMESMRHQKSRTERDLDERKQSWENQERPWMENEQSLENHELDQRKESRENQTDANEKRFSIYFLSFMHRAFQRVPVDGGRETH